jgi:hypothetical protein
MRSWRIALKAKKNTTMVLFQDKKTIREKCVCRRPSTHGISKAGQPSGLDGRGEDEFRIKTRSEGRVAEAVPVDYFLRDSRHAHPKPSNLERLAQFWR